MNGLLAVSRRHRLPYRRGQTDRLARRANHQQWPIPETRTINSRLDRRRQAEVFDVGRHADDWNRHRIREHYSHQELFSDRVFAREIATRQSLVDDEDVAVV